MQTRRTGRGTIQARKWNTGTEASGTIANEAVLLDTATVFRTPFNVRFCSVVPQGKAIVVIYDTELSFDISSTYRLRASKP
jgi:hypothetical protein